MKGMARRRMVACVAVAAALVLQVSTAVPMSEIVPVAPEPVVKVYASRASAETLAAQHGFVDPRVNRTVCPTVCRDTIYGTALSVIEQCDFRDVCITLCSVGHNFVNNDTGELVHPETPYPDLGPFKWPTSCKGALGKAASLCATGDHWCACSACGPKTETELAYERDLRDSLRFAVPGRFTEEELMSMTAQELRDANLVAEPERKARKEAQAAAAAAAAAAAEAATMEAEAAAGAAGGEQSNATSDKAADPTTTTTVPGTGVPDGTKPPAAAVAPAAPATPAASAVLKPLVVCGPGKGTPCAPSRPADVALAADSETGPPILPSDTAAVQAQQPPAAAVNEAAPAAPAAVAEAAPAAPAALAVQVVEGPGRGTPVGQGGRARSPVSTQ